MASVEMICDSLYLVFGFESTPEKMIIMDTMDDIGIIMWTLYPRPISLLYDLAIIRHICYSNIYVRYTQGGPKK